MTDTPLPLDLPAPLEPPPPDASATVRLTQRNRALLARGVHPATMAPLDPDHRCGTCAHHLDAGYDGYHFHKCELHRLGMSHSTASDIRVGWPAYTRWEAE